MSADLSSTSGVDAKPETEDFEFTRIIYIAPHASYTRKVKIHDMTNSISAPYGSEDFPSETERAGKSLKDASPLYTVLQPGWFQTSTIVRGSSDAVSPGSSNETSDSDALAKWKPSRSNHASQTFMFPETSPYSSHRITIKRSSALTYSEAFVKDSVEYIWKFKAGSRRRITLWKKIGGRETAIAKYLSPIRFGRTGGTLLVNGAEVDILVAILTCFAALRKVRQRG